MGASTYSGGGLPMVLESARLTSERIQADLQMPARRAHRRTGLQPAAAPLSA